MMSFTSVRNWGALQRLTDLLRGAAPRAVKGFPGFRGAANRVIPLP